MARAFAASGHRSAGLIGDRRITEGGNLTLSGLWIAQGNQADQWEAFEKVTVRPQVFGHLEAELKEDAEIQFGQPDDEKPEVSVWSALPVHQKVAALFMPGLDMRKSLQLYKGLYTAAGEENYDLLDGLCEFVWSAANRAKALGSRASALDKKWTQFDHYSSEETFEWYELLLDSYATPVRWAQPMPPIPPPPGGNILGADAPYNRPKETKKHAYMQAELGQLFYLVGIDHVEVGDHVLAGVQVGPGKNSLGEGPIGERIGC